MKKKLLVALGTLMITAATMGVEVKLWEKWQAALDPAYDRVIESFEVENPEIKISRVHYETEDLRNNFQNAAFAGNPPALVVGPADTVGVYSQMGIIKPISEVAGMNDEIIKKLLPQGLEQLTLNGELYGIPEQIGNHLTLIYNKKYVKKVPETFEELMETEYASDYKLVYNLNEPFWLVGFLGAYGGWVFDVNGKPSLNTPEMIKALEFVHTLKESKTVPKEADYVVADSLFKDEKAAFIINGDWSYNDYKNNLEDNMGLARVPKVTGGNFYTPMTAVHGIFVADGLEEEVEIAASKFIEYLTSKEVQLEITKANKTLPVNIEASKSADIVNDSFLSGSVIQMLEGKPMPVIPEMRAVWDAIKPFLEEVMNGTTTPKDAAKGMQELAEKKIKQMNQ